MVEQIRTEIAMASEFKRATAGSKPTMDQAAASASSSKVERAKEKKSRKVWNKALLTGSLSPVSSPSLSSDTEPPSPKASVSATPRTGATPSDSQLDKSAAESIAAGIGPAQSVSEMDKTAGEGFAAGIGPAQSVSEMDKTAGMSKREKCRREKGFVRKRAGQDQSYYARWYRDKRCRW